MGELFWCKDAGASGRVARLDSWGGLSRENEYSRPDACRSL